MGRISIALATYNGAGHLQEQLKSFVDQSRRPDELIICDDRSTDDTLNILEEFVKVAPFEVRYFVNEKNLGYSQNFNKALLNTTGDLVFLSDQDDLWFENKIKYIELLSIENPEYLLYMNDAAITDESLNESGRTKLRQFRDAGYSDEVFVTGCCCAVRRELLDLCLPVPNGFRGHDRWIAQFADGMRAKLISERVLQYYRRHENNASSSLSNSTKVLSYWDGFKYKLNNLNAGRGHNYFISRQQMTLFISGVERAISKIENKHKNNLTKFLVRTKQNLAEQDARQIIRDKPLLLRIAAVCFYLIKGNYRKSSGLMSAARDLLG